MKQFYDEFVAKIKVYDPLDREVKDEEGEIVSISRDEFLTQLRDKSTFIKCNSQLSASMSEDSKEKLDEQFCFYINKCKGLIDKSIKAEMTDLRDYHKEIMETLAELDKHLTFFEKYRLLDKQMVEGYRSEQERIWNWIHIRDNKSLDQEIKDDVDLIF